jgi:DNA (cytosine-5)-methyltransferase 1
LKVIDLFCGCGGLSTGFKSEGFHVLLGADINPHALKTYSRNFPGAKTIESDLSTVDPKALLRGLALKSGELDCLVGGPPCQGFSKNVRAKDRYHSDPRNLLLLTYIEFVKAFKPKFVLIENVAEMMNAFKSSYTDQIVESLEKAGYGVESERLLAADYGVPQLRRRAFFFANRVGAPITVPVAQRLRPKDRPGLFTKELPRGYVNVWEAISDLPPLEAGEGENPCEYAKEPTSEYQKGMRTKSRVVYDHVARRLTQPQLDRVRHLQPGMGGGVEELPNHLRPRSGYSGAYARLIPDEPARTITRWVFHPGSGRFYHPFDNRVITIREAARLQSFPDWFSFEGTYIQKSHQVGEAVPPLLAQAFAAEVRKSLG